jgi:yapsin 1
MKVWLISAILVLGAVVEAKGVINLDIQGTRTNVHPIGRYEALYPEQGGLVKRADGTIAVEIDNQFTFYQVTVKVGTPQQTFFPVVDTGSSDLWAISSNDPFCATTQQELEEQGFIDCTTAGTFNYNKSSTFTFNQSAPFAIQYQDGTFAEGQWGTDVVNIGPANLPNCSIAIGLEANSSQGVMGIGFMGLESTNTGPPASFNNGGTSNPQGNPYTYLNVPALLKAQGNIEANAYSLWLNDVDASSGQLLFGGVDHDKYQGTLLTVPIINTVSNSPNPIMMQIVLDTVDLTDSTGNTQNVMTGATPALLDSGTSFTYLPSRVVSSVASAINAEFMNELGVYITECQAGNGDAALVFTFSGANITVGLSEVLFPLTDTNGAVATFQNGQPSCALGVLPASQIILGDSFLRSAYVVYDLDRFEISLANTKFNQTNSDVDAINSNGVPSATKAPNYSSTQLARSIQVNQVTGSFGDSTNSRGSLETGSSDSSPASATGKFFSFFVCSFCFGCCFSFSVYRLFTHLQYLHFPPKFRSPIFLPTTFPPSLLASLLSPLIRQHRSL